MVVLTFVRPEIRKKWKYRVLPFISKKNSITLKCSDTLSSDDPFVGYDDSAVALQYVCWILNKPGLKHREVREIGKAAAGVEPIDVQEHAPVDSPFSTHYWAMVFDQLNCPTDLVNV
jgi:hypothetical protein